MKRTIILAKPSLSTWKVCLPRNSASLSLYKVDNFFLWPIQFVKSCRVHYHVLLTVWCFENHVLRVGASVHYSVNSLVPFVHFALPRFNLLIKFLLELLSILLLLEYSDLFCSQVRLK